MVGRRIVVLGVFVGAAGVDAAKVDGSLRVVVIGFEVHASGFAVAFAQYHQVPGVVVCCTAQEYNTVNMDFPRDFCREGTFGDTEEETPLFQAADANVKGAGGQGTFGHHAVLAVRSGELPAGGIPPVTKAVKHVYFHTTIEAARSVVHGGFGVVVASRRVGTSIAIVVARTVVDGGDGVVVASRLVGAPFVIARTIVFGSVGVVVYGLLVGTAQAQVRTRTVILQCIRRIVTCFRVGTTLVG